MEMIARSFSAFALLAALLFRVRILLVKLSMPKMRSCVSCILFLCTLVLTNGHLVANYFSFPTGVVIYTRSTGYTDAFYLWASSYHPQNSGCLYREDKDLKVQKGTGANIAVVTRPGYSTVCSSNPSLYKVSGNHPYDMWKNDHCFRTQGATYIGKGPTFIKRAHFTGGDFGSYWYQFPPIQLWANAANPVVTNRITFRGFGCENQDRTYDFTVHYGCPKGMWEDTTVTWDADSSPDYCKPCPAGRYTDQVAQAGTSSAVCKVCPKGKFGDENAVPKRDSANYCAKCPAGRYGDVEELSDGQCSGPCLKGFYCPSTVLNEKNTGGTTGSPDLQITAAYYGAASSSSATPHPCPAGFYCPEGSGDSICNVPAPVGEPNPSYSIAPDGTFSWTANNNGKNRRCRLRCGDYTGCSAVELADNQENGAVLASKCYCPAGSSLPIFVSPGYFASGRGDHNYPDRYTRDSQSICEPPNYCLGGACSDERCDGWFHKCPAGRYGANGATGLSSSACSGPCRAGYYCEEGSGQADQKQCGSADKFCPPSSHTPHSVQANFMSVCPESSPQGVSCPHTTREAEAPCPEGGICENGVLNIIKWSDDSGLGLCKMSDQLDSNSGHGMGQIYENIVNAKLNAREANGEWTDTYADIRAQYAGTPVTNGYTKISERCLAGAKSNTDTSDLSLHSRKISPNGKALSTTACSQYNMIVEVSHTTALGTATGNCSIIVDVLNVNDPPTWQLTAIVPRGVEERSIVGTRANRGVSGPGTSGKYALGQTIAIPMAIDPDVGQDVFYSIVAGDPADTNTTFGISKCSGDLYVTSKNKALVFDASNPYVHVCLKACDDPAFFGDRPEEAFVSQCASATSINDVSRCGNNGLLNTCNALGGLCMNVYIIDVNDPPAFNATATECIAGATTQCRVDELSSFGSSIKLNDNTGNADISQQASDIDGDVLKWSAKCLSCTPQNVASIQRGNPASVTTGSEHSFQSGDRVIFEGVEGMIEVNAGSPRSTSGANLGYLITKTGETSFILVGFDSQNLQSAAGGSGGTVRLAPVSVAGGVFRTNVLSSRLVFLDANLYSVEVSVSDTEFTRSKMFQIKLNDVNEPPIFPSNIVLSIYENSIGNATGFFEATDKEYSIGIVYTVTSPSSGFTTVKSNAGSGKYTIGVNPRLDYETKTLHSIAVQATDAGLDPEKVNCFNLNACKESQTAQGVDVILSVLDINEPPTVLPTVAKSIPENSNIGSEVVNTNDYNYDDPENVASKTFQMSESPCFNINIYTGQITVKTELDYYLDISPSPPVVSGCKAQNHTLVITVQDDIPRSGITTTITVSVTNVDELPWFTPPFSSLGGGIPTTSKSFAEDTGDGTIVKGVSVVFDLSTVTKDPEAQTKVYALVSGHISELEDGRNITQFALDGPLIKVDVASDLDYEMQSVFTLVVSVADPSGHASTGRILVTLLDRNDAPELVSTTLPNDPATWLKIRSHRSDCVSQPAGTTTCASSLREKAMKGSQEFNASDIDQDENNQKYVYKIIDYKKRIPGSLAWLSDTLQTFEIDHLGRISVNSGFNQQNIDSSGLQNPGTHYKLTVIINNTFAVQPRWSSPAAEVYINVTAANDPPYFMEKTHVISLNESAELDVVVWGGIEAKDDKTAQLSFNAEISKPENNLYYNFDPDFLADLEVSQSAMKTLFSSSGTIDRGIVNGAYVSEGSIRLRTSKGIDFERGGYAWDDHVLNVTITVFDGKTSATATLSVIIVDVNEPPIWKMPNYAMTLWENNVPGSIEIANFVALDVDFDDRDELLGPWKNEEVKRPTCVQKCTYSIFNIRATKNNQVRPNIIMELVKDTAKKTLNLTVPAFNFEITDSIVVLIKVNDYRAPNIKISTELAVSILDRNEPPNINIANRSLNEDISVGWTLDIIKWTSDPDEKNFFTFTKPSERCVYSQSTRTNASAFSISANKFLKLEASLDYENCQKYEVVIRVSDGGNGIPTEESLSASATFYIDVNNVNDVHVQALYPSESAYSNLNTTGGESVVLIGSNYGPTTTKKHLMNLPATTAVAVEYAKCTSPTNYIGTLYSARSCEVQNDGKGNVKIKCSTAPGVGRRHCWRVRVLSSNHVSAFSSQTSGYTPPSINEAPGSYSLTTIGGTAIVIGGNNFGDGSVTPTVRYMNDAGTMFRASSCSVTTAHLRISCISSSGAGKHLEWFVNVDGTSSQGYKIPVPVDVGSSFQKSSIYQLFVDGYGEGLSGYLLLGKGGQLIRIVGQNFGPNGTFVNVEYGANNGSGTIYTAHGCAVVIDHSVIECKSVSGIGKNLNVRVAVAGLSGSWSSSGALLSYQAPVITKLAGAGVEFPSSTTGNTPVEIQGRNFGPAYTAPCNIMTPGPNILTVKYGDIYKARCCKIVSNEKMQCLTNEGVGKDHAWVVTLADQTSSLFMDASTTYAQPVIRDYEKVTVATDELNTLGGQEIFIVGRNLGPYRGSNGMQNFNRISYGQGDGLEYRLNPARDCSMIEPHLKIRCKIIAGAGTQLKWIMYVGGQESVSPTTAYGPPSITSIGPSVIRKHLRPMGGETVYITGTNFGPKGAPGPYLEKVTYGVNGDFYDITSACHVSIDSTQITCITSAGMGGNDEYSHLWYVTIRGQRSEKNANSIATTSYRRPTLSKIVADHGPTHATKVVQGVTSAIKLTLTGENLGYYSPLGRPNRVWVIFNGLKYSPEVPRIAPKGANASFGGEESIIFNMPVGYGTDRSVDLTIQSSNEEDTVNAVQSLSFNYDSPQVQNVRLETFSNPSCYTSLEDGKQYCQNLLTVEGDNFCSSEMCGLLYVNGRAQASEMYSHTLIVAKVYAGVGSVNVSVSDGVGGWRWSNTEVFASLSPKLSSENATALAKLTFTTIPHDDEIWIAGERFDGDYSKLCVTVGHCPTIQSYCHYNEPCDPKKPEGGRMTNLSSWYPRTGTIKVVVFKLPEGAGLQQELLVWKGGQPSSIESPSNRLYINFKKPSFHPGYIVNDKPIIKSITGSFVSEVNTLGGGHFIIEGQNFGNAHFGSLTFGHSGKRRRRMRMLIRRFLNGLNAFKPPPVRLNDAHLIDSWTHNKITFKMPEGQGVGLSLTLSVGGQSPENGAIVLSYAPPTVNAVSPGFGPTMGGTVVTVTGTNFGCSPKTNTLCAGNQRVLFLPNHGKYPTLKLTPYSCTVSIASHSSLVCTSNEGEGEGRSAQVFVGLISSIPKQNSFSYNAPTISSISHSTSSTSGLYPGTTSKIIMSIKGNNFGPSTASSAHVEFQCVKGISTYCRHGNAIRVNSSAPHWSKNHTHVEFAIPEGSGANLQIIVIVAGVASNVSIFSYESPVIYSISPSIAPTDGCGAGNWEILNSWKARVDEASPEERLRNPRQYERRCKRWNMVTIKGRNFGPSHEMLKIWMGKCSYFKTEESCRIINERICKWTNNRCKNAANTHTGGPFLAFDGAETTKKSLLDCANPLTREEQCMCRSSFSHERICICAPQGFGKNLSVILSVNGRETKNHIPWNYEKPEVQRSMPRPYDARGELIEIRGINFGGLASPTHVLLSGKECTDAKWNKEHPDDGLPFVTCTARESIVGAKNISLQVALQESDAVQPLKNMKSSLVYSICKFGKLDRDGRTEIYWGAEGDLCVKCPLGASCALNSVVAPNSSIGFYREALDISEPASISSDILGERASDDYKRAQRRCPKERLLTPEIKAKFPLAKQRDQCFDFVACIPQDACTGNNDCAPAYLHEKNNCIIFESKEPAKTSCDVDMQCRVRSGGLSCVAAIRSVCQCLPQWFPNADVLTCLKACIRDEEKGKLLVSACGQLKGRQTSVLAKLQEIVARGECGKQNPEDCSRCVTRTNGTTGAYYGECECVSSYRCSLCTSGTHFRIKNKCEECPNNPLLFIILAGFGIFGLCVLMYELDRRRFNLAFINIGWDYFQVLSMFTDADVTWPQALQTLYRFFSLFSFDIDIVAPECLVPDFSYRLKFWITILSPVACACVLIVALGCSLVFHHTIRGVHWKQRDKKIFARFIATFLLMCYFLYVTVTRRALEIFNCNPLPGADDGFLYTDFTSFECDSGPCRCNDPRHLQVALQAPAVVTLLAMTIGFPTSLLFLLRSKKTLIKEDQLLRAAGIGDREETSSNKLVYAVRLSYHKMYYQFLPGKTYWIIYIILRKGAIAIAALAFRANPGFQLAIVVLVLFIAYVLQVKHRPYMSTSQRKEALAEHSKKVEEGDETHIRIRDRIKNARNFVDEQNKRKREKKAKGGGVVFARTKIQSDRLGGVKLKAREYFWDYNTVEQVLLACAILVALAGVMFESDRFQNDISGAFLWQRELITYLTILVVIFSLAYYFVVFVFELYGKTPKCIAKLVGAAKGDGKSADRESLIGGAAVELAFFNNPLTTGKTAGQEREREEAKAKLKNLEVEKAMAMEQNRQLIERIRADKHSDGKKRPGIDKRAKKKKGKGKVEFSQARLRHDSRDNI